MRRMLRASLLVSLVCVAAISLAWDETGHRVVARIAWDTLGKTAEGKAARDKFSQILMKGDEPFAMDSVDDVDDFTDAATWADYIKAKNVTGPYIDLADKYNDETYPPTTPNHEQDHENTRCRFWHYFDTPLNLATGVTPFTRPYDGKQAFKRAVTEIGSGDDMHKAWWAYWILHLTGDFHQPLHCVSDFTVPVDANSGLTTGDNGGNSFKLDGRRNLHGFWDGEVTVATSKVRSIAHRAKKVEDAAPIESFGDKVNDLNVDDWVAEGANLAKTLVYVGVTQGQAPDDVYTQKADKVATQQAALAGYRLANLIKKLMA